jgi:hypothetical protein
MVGSRPRWKNKYTGDLVDCLDVDVSEAGQLTDDTPLTLHDLHFCAITVSTEVKL